MRTHRLLGFFLMAAITGLAAPTLSAADASTYGSVTMVRNLDPVYPLDQLIKGHTGWAEVHFMVDYSGRAVMTSISGASSPAFGQSLLAEIESNEFLPPRVNGQPQLALSSQHYIFGGDAGLNPEQRRVIAELRKPMPAIVPVAELDKPLAALHQDPPVYPYALQSDSISGRAEVEFIVDREGHVIFPKILSASHEDFGWAAATGVTRWRFQPPVKGGQKVDAKMSVTMKFDYGKGTVTW